MTEFDKEYIKLLKKILSEGVEVENRTGINTIKIPSYNFHFDLTKEYPILQTKKTYYKKAIIELLWIWQQESNDVNWLNERNVKIWDEWKIDEDGIYRIYEPSDKCEYDPDKEVIVLDPLSASIDDPFAEKEPLKPKLDEEGRIMVAKGLIPGKTIKTAKYYGKEFANTIGTAYGFITGRYHFAESLIRTIKENPTDRRMVKLLWQNEFLRTAVLPSCVWGTEWDVTGDKLSLLVHQRSCDVPLGLPFNITQYATFLKMIAQVTNKEASTIEYSIKDAHIYVNQLEGITEQIRRANLYEELRDKSELELLCMMRNNALEMKHLDERSKEYQILDSNNKIIDIILDPTKPELVLDESVNDFFDFDSSKELKHIKVKNYKDMGKISMPVAQ